METTMDPRLDPQHLGVVIEAEGGAQGAEQLVYGDWGGGLVFMDRDHALDLAHLHQVLGEAKTWGDLWSRLPRERFEEIWGIVEGDEERKTFWDYWEELKDEEFFGDDPTRVSLEEGHRRYRELPVHERHPMADDPFEARDIWGFGEGDYPEWPAQGMLHWIPDEIQERYGEVEASVHNGNFLVLASGSEQEIAEALRGYGYSCILDQALIERAHGA
ncbi:MAG: hypothetical protein ABH877_05175 [bacterium]